MHVNALAQAYQHAYLHQLGIDECPILILIVGLRHSPLLNLVIVLDDILRDCNTPQIILVIVLDDVVSSLNWLTSSALNFQPFR